MSKQLFEAITDRNTIEVKRSINNLNFYAEPSLNLPRFVLNVIFYVPDNEGSESGDSSDEECSDNFFEHNNGIRTSQYISPYELDHLNIYKTHTVKTINKKLTKSDELGKFNSNEPELKRNIDIEKQSPSRVQKFLDQLKNEGFETANQDNFNNLTSIVIGLNRPKSLSTRKNNVLQRELDSEVTTPIQGALLGRYWEYNWYDNNGKPVIYEQVKSFYKQLKRYDKNMNTCKAHGFRKDNEKLWDQKTKEGTRVPYQALREWVKENSETKELVRKLSTQNASDIYFSFIDADTINFNGIYSAYLRIYKEHFLKHNQGPTVMSTGYEFGINEAAEYLYQVGSQLDRAIRVETAKHIPAGVYYPEPNFCVLLPKNNWQGKWIDNCLNDCLESFFDNEIKEGDRESVGLLRKVVKRQGATFIFSDDKPLITNIPSRAKTSNTLSSKFCSTKIPTEEDLKALKFNQSHFTEQNWAHNLYMNRAFELKPVTNRDSGKKVDWKTKFVGPVKKLLNNELTDQDKYLLEHSVPEEILHKIYAAAEGVRAVIDKFKTADEAVNNNHFNNFNVNAKEDILPLAIKSGSKLVETLIKQQSEGASLNEQQKLEQSLAGVHIGQHEESIKALPISSIDRSNTTLKNDSIVTPAAVIPQGSSDKAISDPFIKADEFEEESSKTLVLDTSSLIISQEDQQRAQFILSECLSGSLVQILGSNITLCKLENNSPVHWFNVKGEENTLDENHTIETYKTFLYNSAGVDMLPGNNSSIALLTDALSTMDLNQESSQALGSISESTSTMQ